MSASRIRSIKPECWGDEKIGALSRDARLLFWVLVTMADDEGRLRTTPRGILGHGYEYDEDATDRKLSAWLGELVASTMLLVYEVEGVPYAAFRHWRRHQRIQRPRASVLPPPPDPGVVRENAAPDSVAVPDASGTHRGSIQDGAVTDTGSILDGEVLPRVPIRSDPDPVVDLIDARGLAERCAEASEIAISRWPEFDPVAVENIQAMYPSVDVVAAVRLGVLWAGDAGWKIDSGAATVRAAARKLATEGEAAQGASAKADEKQATTDRRKAAAMRVYGKEAAA